MLSLTRVSAVLTPANVAFVAFVAYSVFHKDRLSG